MAQRSRNRFTGLIILTAIVWTAVLSHHAAAQSVDIAAGRKRAEVCMACHGEKGFAVDPGIPNLAGQDQEYLEKALKAYRGAQLRQDPTMTEMAKPLTDADIANLAAFWHSLPGKSSQ